MVEDSDAQEGADVLEASGESEILGRGPWISRRVIVDEGHVPGVADDRWLADLGRLNERGGGRPRRCHIEDHRSTYPVAGYHDELLSVQSEPLSATRSRTFDGNRGFKGTAAQGAAGCRTLVDAFRRDALRRAVGWRTDHQSPSISSHVFPASTAGRLKRAPWLSPGFRQSILRNTAAASRVSPIRH